MRSPDQVVRDEHSLQIIFKYQTHVGYRSPEDYVRAGMIEALKWVESIMVDYGDEMSGPQCYIDDDVLAERIRALEQADGR